MERVSFDERKFLISLLSKHKEIKNGYYYYTHKGKHYKEHRILMELILGRKLRMDEVVHHKDHNKLNNRINNLEVMKLSDHNSLHHAGLKKPTTNQNPPHKLSEDKIKKIKELSKTILKKNGKPHFSKIAKELEISDFTVARHLKI